MALGPSVLNPSGPIETVMHFDLRGAPPTITAALLEVPVQCLDPGGSDGSIAFYVFEGDGEASLDEYYLGTLETTKTGLTVMYETVSVDMTTAVQAAITAGYDYIGFRLLSPPGGDRFNLGNAGGVANPTLTCTW